MFKLNPVFKDYLWGGNKLKDKYNKKSPLDITAESWELSTHKDGLTLLENGDTLLSYVQANGKSVLGDKCTLDNDIPILIKFIDAKQALSIQVHPDDEFALKNEADFGKTEMWYIVEAEPNAKLIYGFKKDISETEFKNAIETNSLEELINEVSVVSGDVLFINPGTMHAIGAGIVIAEIQQRSNVTYRIYDFGRLGADGKPRDLHVEKALQVTNLKASDNAKVAYSFKKETGYEVATLADCNYFNVKLLNVFDKATLYCDKSSFNCITIIEGDCQICDNTKCIDLVKGDSVFLPANTMEYTITGTSKAILSSL